MGHFDVPEILIALGIVGWLGLAMYNWRHHRHSHRSAPVSRRS
jgi:hypothetical protein